MNLVLINKDRITLHADDVSLFIDKCELHNNLNTNMRLISF